MKTKYKHIEFQIDTPDMLRWFCANRNSGSIIGETHFYEPWNQWVMEFKEDCVFNNSCLRDIADFLTQLNATKH